MKVLKKIAFLASLTAVVFFLSCKKDKDQPSSDETVVIKIKVSSEETNLPTYEEFKVSLKELRTLKITETSLNAEGVAQAKIDKGTYTISVEWKKGNVSVFGTLESYSINKAETLSISLVMNTMQPEGLIFKEIFFNGEQNDGVMMHPDQYFVLYNNSDETIYADGVAFSVTAHANFREADIFSDELPQNIVVAQIYSIPGNGFDYPVEPGEQIVIARTAINHNAEYENAVDLSGADFEVYEPNMPEQFGTDVDNPNVPNLIEHFTAFGIFAMHPRGFMPPIIFKPDTDMETFMANHQFEYENSQGEVAHVYSVPTELVIDGIETGNEGYLTVKSLPASVDKSSIGVTGCHQQQLIQRKIGEGNKLKDTNDTAEDCERVIGQNAFPAEEDGKGMYIPGQKLENINISVELSDFDNSFWNLLK